MSEALPVMEVTRQNGDVMVFGAHIYEFVILPKGRKPKEDGCFLKLVGLNTTFAVQESAAVVVSRYNSALAMAGVLKVQQAQGGKQSDILLARGTPPLNSHG